MKKTMFFDLGNVLLFFSHDRMCAQIADFCNLKKEKIYEMLVSGEIGENYEKGIFDSKMVHGYISALCGKNLDFHGLMHAIADIFQSNTQISPIVNDLKKNNVRLILLSNICEAQFDFAYRHFPILQLFDAYVLSYQVKSRKPEPLIYQKALALAECPIEDCFYTDDIPENIRAANAQGLDAEVYTDTEVLKKDLILRGFLS